MHSNFSSGGLNSLARTSTLVALSLFVFGPEALAQDTISTDVSVSNAPGTVIEDHVSASFAGAGSVATIGDLGLPPEADISALHYVDGNTVLFSLKTTTQLGSVVASPGDVLQWQSSVITRIASRTDLGLGSSTSIDALTKNGEALIFSVDVADEINAVAITDSDILSWMQGADAQLLHGQAVCGIPDETDLSGLHRLDSGHFLMTFSNAAIVGGIPFRKGDILRCNPASGTVTQHRRFSDLGGDWTAAAVDAISQYLRETIFRDGFENIN